MFKGLRQEPLEVLPALILGCIILRSGHLVQGKDGGPGPTVVAPLCHVTCSANPEGAPTY